MTQPTVSILTATYNRRMYLPSLIDMVRAQTYNLRLCEWVIVDDSPESNADLFEALARLKTVKVRYYHFIPEPGTKLMLGAKRNWLNELAENDILINFDDDDFHLPERISHSVAMMSKFKTNIAGNSRMMMFFADDDKICEYIGDNIVGRWSNHFTNGTIAFTKEFARTHRYDDTATYAEEASFCNGYTEPVLQLDPMRTILVKCHPGNTVDKRFMRLFNPQVKPTALKLRDFIKDPKMREVFKQLGRFNGEPIRLPPSVAKRLAEQEANQQAETPSVCNDESCPPERQCAENSGPQ